MAAVHQNLENNYDYADEVNHDNTISATANEARRLLPPYLDPTSFINTAMNRRNMHDDLPVTQDEIQFLHLNYMLMYGKWNDFMYYTSSYLQQFQDDDARNRFINQRFDWLNHGGTLFFTCALWNAPFEIITFIHNEGCDISIQNNMGEYPEEVVEYAYYDYNFNYICPNPHVTVQNNICDENNLVLRRDINDFEDVRYALEVIAGEAPPPPHLPPIRANQNNH